MRGVEGGGAGVWGGEEVGWETWLDFVELGLFLLRFREKCDIIDNMQGVRQKH